MSDPTPRPGSLAAWVLASRPKTLPAAVAPVGVGVAAAAALGSVRPLPSLAALGGALALQIGANFANDLFDFEKGADTSDRLGPKRAVQSGLLSASAVRAGTALAMLAATLAGVYLVAVAGWPIVAIGIASILCALAYTGGPYPLGYHGLGDLFVFIFFGPVAVVGTVYVNTGRAAELAWWAAVPMGCLTTAILVVNNLRDRETDALAGKRTLAVRLGRGGAEVEYLLLLAISFLVPLAVMLRFAGRPALWLPLLALPLAGKLFGQVRTLEGPPLNQTLAGTARLTLVFAVLFSLALVLGLR